MTSQELCLSCGLCCDGTLFGRVPLKASDAVTKLQVGGVEIQANGTRQYFKLPCPAHRQGCCQVYADRPSGCRRYRCELLKKYEAGAVPEAEALQKIRHAQMLKESLRTEVARLVPECERMSLIATWHLAPARAELAADPDLRKTWAPVMLRFAALFDCLRTNFQDPCADNGSTGPTERQF